MSAPTRAHLGRAIGSRAAALLAAVVVLGSATGVVLAGAGSGSGTVNAAFPATGAPLTVALSGTWTWAEQKAPCGPGTGANRAAGWAIQWGDGFTGNRVLAKGTRPATYFDPGTATDNGVQHSDANSGLGDCGTATSGPASGTWGPIAHTYAQPGTYTACVVIYDIHYRNVHRTTLAAAITATQASFAVVNTVAIASGDVLLVDNEQMLVTGKSGNVITVNRGVNLTGLVSHGKGATVFGIVLADTKQLVAGSKAARYTAGDHNADNSAESDGPKSNGAQCLGTTFTVKATPTLTSTASGPVSVGQDISDTAHLSGIFEPPCNGGQCQVTLATVWFDVFAPADTTCQTPIEPPLVTIPTTISDGDYGSYTFTTDTVGDYRWVAHYSGDAFNNPVDSPCNDPAETSTTVSNGLQPECDDSYYPFTGTGSTELSRVPFNESEVLRSASPDLFDGTFKLFYNDEHAIALGVRQVSIITSGGTTTTDYPVSPLASDPGSVTNPAVGGTYTPPPDPLTVTPADLAAAQAQGNTDASGRPLFPSLYLTDITTDVNNHAGDWQSGGTPIPPTAVFGTWKAFTETIDQTTATPTVTLTADADPTPNDWNLGPGADTPPPGLLNEGYGFEARWSLNDLQAKGLVIPGHAYRFYVIDHDGDQNKTGGDTGQACFNYFYPGPVTNPSTLAGTVYNDANNNGIEDGTEAGIARVTVKLLDNLGNVLTSVTADSSGAYSFTNLPAGTSYRIVEIQPGSYLDGKDTQGSGSGVTNVSVTNDIFKVAIAAAGNAAGSGYNFGEVIAASSATSAVSDAFTSTAIDPGNTLWFSSAFTMDGLPGTGTTDVTMRAVNMAITLTTTTQVYTIPVPDALVTFKDSISDSTATTTFDATHSSWVTTAGKATAGQYLLSALPWAVPAGVTNLAGATVRWTGTFLVDTAGVDISSWAGAAAVYDTQVTSFPTNFNLIGVKPVDGSTNQYANTDPAGSPENETPQLIAGALGTGGAAYIGGYTASADPTAAQVPNLNPVDPTETFQTTPVTP
jgi:hypothetical protein